MKHVVLVPAWRRPDMLYACLSRLEKAARPGVEVVVSLDRGYDKETREAANQFTGRLPVLYLRLMHHHMFRGNSYNVLSGLADCLKSGPDLVHVVEEDIMVADGYFEFHEAMHRAAPGAFAVSACRNQNAPATAAAYLHPSYQSLGVSMRPDIVEKLARHTNPVYFGDMVMYCRKHFPASRIPPGHAEQDGLINRIRESMDGRTVYAERPRAYHAGFHGYNRPGVKLQQGPYWERAEKILSMTSAELNEMAGEIKDYEAFDLNEVLPLDREERALADRRVSVIL